LCGTNSGADDVTQYDALSYEFEERAAIAEYDGQQTPQQAQRIAYLDAFMAVLSTLPYEEVEGYYDEDWLTRRVKAAQHWLVAEGLQQSK
jgi:phosphoserine phosphatase